MMAAKCVIHSRSVMDENFHVKLMSEDELNSGLKRDEIKKDSWCWRRKGILVPPPSTAFCLFLQQIRQKWGGGTWRPQF